LHQPRHIYASAADRRSGRRWTRRRRLRWLPAGALTFAGLAALAIELLRSAG
jgi:hypothetical protein